LTRLTQLTRPTHINCLNWSYACRSVSRQCRSGVGVYRLTLVSDVSIVSKSVQVSIDTGVIVSSRGSRRGGVVWFSHPGELATTVGYFGVKSTNVFYQVQMGTKPAKVGHLQSLGVNSAKVRRFCATKTPLPPPPVFAPRGRTKVAIKWGLSGPGAGPDEGQKKSAKVRPSDPLRLYYPRVGLRMRGGARPFASPTPCACVVFVILEAVCLVIHSLSLQAKMYIMLTFSLIFAKESLRADTCSVRRTAQREIRRAALEIPRVMFAPPRAAPLLHHALGAPVRSGADAPTTIRT